MEVSASHPCSSAKLLSFACLPGLTEQGSSSTQTPWQRLPCDTRAMVPSAATTKDLKELWPGAMEKAKGNHPAGQGFYFRRSRR